MIKTVFLVRWDRGDAHIDSRMSVEWPEHLTNEAINTLAQIRGEPPAQTLQELLPPEVLKFLESYQPMELRARFNNMASPYVINSEETPSDEFLLAYAMQKTRNTTKRK